MRFLVGADVPPDPDSGASGTVYHTTAALRAIGHEVDEIWADDLGRRIRHGNLHYLLELPRAYRREVARRCRQRDYDAIMLSQPHAWLAARAHRRAGRPGLFINRSHGFEPMADAAIAHWSRRLNVPGPGRLRAGASALLAASLARHAPLAARHSQSFVVPAEDIRRYMADALATPAERIAVVHHGIHSSFASVPAAPMTGQRLNRLLYVGQFAFIKGPDILARALEHLLSTRPGLSMTWVCSKRHHAEAAALLPPSLHARIQWLDWLAQEQLIDVYDRHGIFLFPSFYEGAGKACLEAMARGLCVVASDVGAMRDYIEDGKNGRLVAPGDVEGLVGAVEWLLADPARAASCAAAARDYASAMTWRHCAEGIVRFVSQSKGVLR